MALTRLQPAALQPSSFSGLNITDGSLYPVDLSTGAPLWNTSGSLGVGTTLNTWYSTYKAIQLSSNASLTSNTDFFAIGNNYYTNASASELYLANGYATKYRSVTSSGQHEWYTSAYGTTGSSITFNQAVTLNQSGALLIGVNSAYNTSRKLQVANGMAVGYGLYTYAAFDTNSTGDVILTSNANPANLGTNSNIIFKLGTSGGGGPIEAMRIDSTGKVGVGVTVPLKNVDIVGTDSSTTTVGVGLSIRNTNSTNDSRAGISFMNYDNWGASIWSLRTGSSAGVLAFGTNNASGVAETNIVERMRIDSNGNLLVGQTANPMGKVTFNGGSASTTLGVKGDTTFTAFSMVSIGGISDTIKFADVDIGGQGLGGSYFQWIRGGSYDNALNLWIRASNNTTANRFQFDSAGNAYKSSGSGTWSALSDIRVKTNVVPVTDGLSRVLELNPVTFDYKSPSAHHDKVQDKGFIADDFMLVYPNSVSECEFIHEDDKQYFEEGEKAKAIGFNAEFYADLVSAIKQQHTIIEQLTARIEALENK